MFPQGGPGIALLILRLSVATIFLTNVVNGLAASPDHIILIAALLVAVLLLIGFLTPYSSFIVVAAAFARLVFSHSAGGSITATFLASIMDAAALMLLGPGAYSLDARLFGRRVIVVPPNKD